MSDTRSKNRDLVAERRPRPWAALAIGAASGLVAAGVLNGLHATVAALSSDTGHDEPPTVKLADKVSEATTGEPVSQAYREHAGQAVHYLTGAALGALYAVVAEYTPGVTAGFGTAYGAGVAVVLDDAILPALGLTEAPWKTSPGKLAFGFASHLLFGATLEGGRAVLGKGVDGR